MPNPRVVQITDLPECDPNVSQSSVIAVSSRVVVIYDAKGPKWPEQSSWAAVRLDECLTYKGGGPNDEAMGNHPLYALGLQFYSLQEVIASPWINEQAAIADKSGDPTRLARGERHFVLALKDDFFECIAEQHTLIGLFETHDAVFAAACKSLRTHR